MCVLLDQMAFLFIMHCSWEFLGYMHFESACHGSHRAGMGVSTPRQVAVVARRGNVR